MTEETAVVDETGTVGLAVVADCVDEGHLSDMITVQL